MKIETKNRWKIWKSEIQKNTNDKIEKKHGRNKKNKKTEKKKIESKKIIRKNRRMKVGKQNEKTEI